MTKCEKCGFVGGFHLCHGNLKPIEKVKITKPKVKKATGRPRGYYGSGPVFDYQKIVELHAAGYTQVDIALEMNCSPQTVRKALKEAYPEGYTTNQGKQRVKSVYCAHGHNNWKPVSTRPSERYCATCQTEYQRTRYRIRNGLPLDAPVRGSSPLCPKEHEPNWEIDKRGSRQCITCRRERQRESYRAKKEKANGM